MSTIELSAKNWLRRAFPRRCLLLVASFYSLVSTAQSQGVNYSVSDTPPKGEQAATAFNDAAAPVAKTADEQKKQAEAQKKAQAELERKIASAHKLMFFDNDFSYLSDPNYSGWQLGDGLKQRPLAGQGWYDIGGQYRTRAHFEQNMRGLGLTGVDDTFLLHRTRLYGDFHFSPNIRAYAELIDANSNYEDFTPRVIEENRTDLLNLFVDARLLHSDQGTLLARVGRQELTYGAQRVISPLDWANTRRNFEGAKLSWATSDWTFDGFWTNPIRIDVNSFDSPDRDQEFMGLYSSYKVNDQQNFDLYALRQLNGRGANNFEYNTFGTRSQGNNEGKLWDFEGAYQNGENNDGSDHSAAMITMGLGRLWDKDGLKPTLWAYHDWASGGDVLGGGQGFHHHFPLAHKYNGFMDLFGRSNLHDSNVSFSVQSTKKLNLLVWYHYFALANRSDTPYSVVISPFNAGNAPGSSDLGHEIDLIADYTVSRRQSLLLGYSHFFGGDYYSSTAGVPFNGDGDFFYSQWSVNF